MKTLLILWGLGFVSFVLWCEKDQEEGQAQAAVVLTGRTARLEEALRLLKNGVVQNIFVSGVNPKTSKRMLQKHYHFDDNAPIELGYKSHNTAENAEETAQWIDRNKVKSFRLVTDSEHMARSFLEMKKKTKAKIILHPIAPTKRRYKILLKEYHKCLFLGLLTGIQYFSKKAQLS